jgi:hypothetical protein
VRFCSDKSTVIKPPLTSRTNYATTSDLGLLAHRLDALESALLKNGSLSPSDFEYFLRASRNRDGISGEAAPAPVTHEAKEDEDNDTEAAALTLEHLAFGRSRVEGSHSIPHFGARMPTSIQKSVLNHNYHLASSRPSTSNTNTSVAIQRSPSLGAKYSPSRQDRGASSGLGATVNVHQLAHGNAFTDSLSPEDRQMRIDALLDLIGPTDVFDLFYRKTDVGMRALTKVLPTREQGEFLVNQVK